MYFQWIAYHSETEGASQQDIWIATMKALKKAIDKAKELKEGTSSTMQTEKQSNFEL
jgi:hypothetical protein